MSAFRAGAAVIFFATAAMPPTLAQRAAPAEGTSRLQLTVDGIMRGPDLVGWPPSGLRWSSDSQQLYFEWRKPREKEASTYVVARAGGEPRKLTDDEVESAPPASGRWDKARRRQLATDRGDVIVHDGPSGRRIQVTRTSGSESNPRWARNDTHVTYVRDGNLFIVPVSGMGSPGRFVTQLTDVAPKRPEPRLTDSQKFIKDEEQKLIEYVRRQREEKDRAEEKARKDKLPSFELQDRQSAVDLMLSPEGTHVFIVVAERPAGAKNTIVPNYVTESGYTEDVPARTNVGDTQERRLLAILNLETGKSVWADGSFAPPVEEPERPKPSPAEKPGETPAPGRRAEREIRWAMPVVSSDGRHVVAAARSADNKERWFVTLDPASGSTRVIDVLRDDAWVRESGFGGGAIEFLPDGHRIAFLSERDGWMHLYTLDVAADGVKARQLTSGRWEVTSADLSADGRRFYITTNEVHPGERHVYTVPRRWW
jgi:hypothetical protein